jgi:spore germination protein GerM
VLLLALVAAGCAIPTQSTPSTMAPSKVPFGLLNPHLPTTTTTTQPKPASYVPVTVYLLDPSDKVTAAVRYVASPAPLDVIIRTMLDGPTSPETAQGVTTAIPSDVALLTVAPPQNGIVTVNMNTAFGTITGNNTELAVAQIVATVVAATSNSTGVLFEIDGQRTSVPIANGSFVSAPVYLLDFLGEAG